MPKLNLTDLSNKQKDMIKKEYEEGKNNINADSDIISETSKDDSSLKDSSSKRSQLKSQRCSSTNSIDSTSKV